jgi:hypothetical protein
MITDPNCRFYRYYKLGRPPSRADRFVGGTISMRAAQYCDPVTAASGFGWSLFVPVDILLVWDGQSIAWSHDGDEWKLIDDCVHFPGFPEAFDTCAPHHLRGMAPAFLTTLPEPGIIQVSLGIFARTAPGWSMLIRRPPNLSSTGHVEHFEGLVDTSRWFGPLFINLRLTKTDIPIRLRMDRPLAHAQPIPHGSFTREALAFEMVDEIEPDDWKAYHTAAAEPNSRPNRAFGEYAADQRRRRNERSVAAAPSS